MAIMKIGWSTRDMTPSRPVMLQGQMHVRVARDAMDPLTVTALAMEGGAPLTRAILISLDFPFVTPELRDRILQRLARRIPEIPRQAVIMVATHTHTAFVIKDAFYSHPGGDVMTAGEGLALAAEKAADAAVTAWEARAPGAVGRAFGHAVVGHNRRACYADGSASMYGQTNRPDFAMIEGYEDHSLDMLFTWDAGGALTGMMLAIPCPSQVDEGISRCSADFWHEIRGYLRRRLGAKLFVLPLCGVAGDQSPHFLLYNREEAEMRRRRGLTERQEIAVRVADAVERALACTRPSDGDVPFILRARRIGLPRLRVTKVQRDWAENSRQDAIQGGSDPKSWWPERLQHVVDSFEHPGKAGAFEIELQALRIGDLGLVTNPFELFLDYGLRIKARSPAPQTMAIQLSAGIVGEHLPIDAGLGWYLPTERALSGGSYGAMPAVACVGPEGGQELVEASLAELNTLFPAK